jgi:hypothetical protein
MESDDGILCRTGCIVEADIDLRVERDRLAVREAPYVATKWSQLISKGGAGPVPCA